MPSRFQRRRSLPGWHSMWRVPSQRANDTIARIFLGKKEINTMMYYHAGQVGRLLQGGQGPKPLPDSLAASWQQATPHQRAAWMRLLARPAKWSHPAVQSLFYAGQQYIIPRQHLLKQLCHYVKTSNTQRRSRYRENRLVTEDFQHQGQRLMDQTAPQFRAVFELANHGVPEVDLTRYQHQVEYRILLKAQATARQQRAVIQAAAQVNALRA
ncbi:MAG: hypothetical protein GY821_11495 [Gammaproteobacteria bacterium]|nr:hypothetical protein [Gammaproteobacteria bacterium]